MTKASFIDYLSLIILILLALAVFLVRIFIPDLDKTPLVDTLFSFFEITFSILIGFILQRLDSTKKFQENLRSYGLSAYRRISDISKSLARARREINLKRKSSTDADAQVLDIISVIIEGADDTVKSSITDWADIIGDDLKTQERLLELEASLSIQMQSNVESQEKERRIQELQNEIQALKSKLPYSLHEYDEMVQVTIMVDSLLGGMVLSASSFILKIKTINRKDFEHFASSIKDKRPCKFVFKTNANTLRFEEVDVYDDRQVLIGQVVNPIKKYNDYFFQKIWETIKPPDGDNLIDSNKSVMIRNAELLDVMLENEEVVIRIPVSSYSAQ